MGTQANKRVSRDNNVFLLDEMLCKVLLTDKEEGCSNWYLFKGWMGDSSGLMCDELTQWRSMVDFVTLSLRIFTGTLPPLKVFGCLLTPAFSLSSFPAVPQVKICKWYQWKSWLLRTAALLHVLLKELKEIQIQHRGSQLSLSLPNETIYLFLLVFFVF